MLAASDYAAVSDADGRWAVSVGIGSKVRFTPSLDDHVFTPARWSGDVLGRVTDADFVDTKERTLDLRLYGGRCDRAVASEVWRLRVSVLPFLAALPLRSSCPGIC